MDIVTLEWNVYNGMEYLQVLNFLLINASVTNGSSLWTPKKCEWVDYGYSGIESYKFSTFDCFSNKFKQFQVILWTLIWVNGLCLHWNGIYKFSTSQLFYCFRSNKLSVSSNFVNTIWSEWIMVTLEWNLQVISFSLLWSSFKSFVNTNLSEWIMVALKWNL